MQESEVRAKLRDWIVKHTKSPSKAAFTDETHILEEGILSSLDIVEFVARLEYRFRFVVPDDEWQQLATLDAIAAYALNHLER